MVAYGIWGAGERFKSDISNLKKGKGGDLIGIVEEWKPLMYGDLDLTNRFLISNTGKLYSLISKKILKTTVNKKGYENICVSLGSREQKKILKIHMAVAFMFVDGYKKGLIVNHKDTNKLNNVYTNLEWVTHAENSQHAEANGLMNHVNLKPIKQIDQKTGKIIKIFESIASAQYYFTPNKRTGNISNAVRGINKTAYGYKWEYI